MNAPLNKTAHASMDDIFSIGHAAAPSVLASPAVLDTVFDFGRPAAPLLSLPHQVMPAKAEDVFIIGSNRPSIIPASAVSGLAPFSALLTISNAEYHSMRDIVSTSMLKKILRSPAHMKAMFRKKKKESPSQRIGTGYHTATLEPMRFLDEYVAYDGRRQGDRWKVFEASNVGKVILTEDEYQSVLCMREATFSYTEWPLKSAIEMGEAEQSIVWTDEETGIRCRIRPDLLLRKITNLMLDLKSTDDARPETFLMQMFKLDYDLQAAMYIQGMYAFTGQWFPFYFVACEDEDPHGVWVYEVLASEADEIYMNGLKKFRRGLEIYKHCVETDLWPKYSGPYSGSGGLHVPKYRLAA